MPRAVILVGYGENARMIEAALAGRRTVKGYLDDRKRGPRIIGPITDAKKYITRHDFFITIGDNATRKKFYHRLKKLGASFATAVHVSSHLETDVVIGDNVFIGPQATINVGAVIGNNTFINTRCIVEHDNVLADHVHLAPGVMTGGGARIGQGTFVGLGAKINDHVVIGAETIIGSGTVVINDIPSRVTAVGVPAKIIKRHRKKP